jgi:endoglucanase
MPTRLAPTLAAALTALALLLLTAPADAAVHQHAAHHRAHHHKKKHHKKKHRRHHQRVTRPAPLPAPVPPTPLPTAAPTPTQLPTPSPSPVASPAPVTTSAPLLDPRLTRQLYVDPGTASYQAWRSDPTYGPIALTPQAFWVTDPTYTLPQLSTYLAGAAAVDATPLVTVYGIPDRDCGGYSSGGLTTATYLPWVGQIADALRGRDAMVVLEPDALAMTTSSCTDPAGRLALLRSAVDLLSAAGAWVYLDAAHAGWVAPAPMAALLDQAGVADARGFAIDVSSFDNTASETAYAEAVLAALSARGVDDSHYVIDTSRNGGATAPAPGDFCNPVEARLGTPPRVFADGSLDTYLWVKHPGQSDGSCDGAPAAGQWYPAYARQLLGLA